MSALPRVRMGCALATGVMETGRVSAVRPVAAVLLATACAGCTRAAAPGDAVGEAVGTLLAAACVGCTGAATPIDVAEVPGEELGIPNPALICAGGGVGASTCPWTT
jgi:hypothetical protein